MGHAIDLLESARSGVPGPSSWQEELGELRAEARRRFGPFVQQRVNPGARERDRTISPLPRWVFAEAAELGLLTFSLPREIGGGGRDKFEWGAIIEQIGYMARDAGLPVLLDINVEVCELILSSGKPDLIDRYVPRLVTAEITGMPAAYESSDPFDYRTTCQRQTDGSWVLNGSKHIVAGALTADIFLVYVRDAESNDILAFVVERADPGVDVARMDLMGLHSMGFGMVLMSDVRVDEEERLVWRSDALSEMNTYARNRRLISSCGVVGAMEATTELCVEALATRIRGGRPVLDYPNVERAVGQMRMETETARAVIYRALDATRAPRDPYFDPLATTAKHYVSEAALRFGHTLMNLHGGHSYMTIRPWEMRMRNFLGLIGGQGAQELLQIQLGQRTIVNLEGEWLRREAAGRTVTRMIDAWWAVSALAAALPLGLLDDQPTSAAAAAPEPLGDALVDVLVAAGLLERTDGRVVASDALRPLISDQAQRRALEAQLHSVLATAGSARPAVGPASNGQGPTPAAPSPPAPLARLLEDAARLPLVASALEAGILDDLWLARDSEHVAETAGIEPDHARALLEALTDAGLLRRSDGRFTADAGAQRLLLAPPRRAAVESGVRSALIEARELLAGARAGTLGSAASAELVAARRGGAAAAADAILDRLLVDLEGVDERLQVADAAILEAGAGQVAVELCRRLPHASALCVDPDAELLRATVDEEHLGDRVELREAPCDAVSERGAFALAWVATAALRSESLVAALDAVHGALVEGGWVVLEAPAVPKSKLGVAVRGLATARHGGTPFSAQALEDALGASGFRALRQLPDVPGLGRLLVAGRRIPS